MFSSLYELFCDLLYGHFFLTYNWPRKINKITKALSSEDWFNQLYNDHRYNYIINYNQVVKEYLSKPGIIRLLKENEKYRQEFIQLVRDEHNKFVKN